ncbi:MFS transporter [Streptomyces lunaelactis]|uniref:MFS transporter n=1 Tax=Streptomyces lunaelactis TaxID=1535768 RepID=A0A2R4SW34_9ACTN|nr:MFS transporter [Streptomyces lunaelactis]AVZ71062.1 MFS transporter [Streptomyces lunaelactis]NUK22645.1 MFS transporter [Streptomyces lunaelactis]NUK87041.1 MFS transporter [Streptomyces lunaelactis]
MADVTSALQTERSAAKPAHKDGTVLRWLAAYTLSVLGDSIYFMALGWAANQIAGPAEVGLIVASGAVPRALLMLGGGVIADRLGPRRVVIGSDTVRFLVIAAAAAAIALTPGHVWLLITVALIFGAVDALFMPAVGALPPRISTPDQLVRIQGMRALAVRGGNTMGPPLAGFAMGISGPEAAFALASSLFGISLLLLLTVHMKPLQGTGDAEDAPRGTSARHDLVEGLVFIRRHKLIGPLVLAAALSELGFAGPLNIGLVFLTTERNWGAGGMGWIVAGFGIGAAASALLLTVLGRLPKAGYFLISTTLVTSACVAAFPAAPALGFTVALAALAGLAGGIAGGLAQALIQAATDHAYLGRVTAVTSLTALGLAPLTYPAFGALVSFGGVATAFAAGGILSAIGMIVCIASPTIRKAELA